MPCPTDLFGRPPLSSISTAVDVIRTGNRYSFVVPELEVPPQWVAYAPLSGAHNTSPELVAHNVRATAVVARG